MDDLQWAMVGSWPPVEQEPLGDWLLRASAGFTNRGNSVMTAGSPGLPVREAIDRVESWYAARGLPPTLALFGPEGFDAAEDEVGRELLGRGYATHTTALVLTAAVDRIADAAPTAGVDVQDRLTPAWLAAYSRQRTTTPGATEAVLGGSPEAWFASASREGQIVAVGRLAVASEWAGLSAIWVAPEARRQGLGQQLAAALCARARTRGIRSVHLQVETDNAAALALYERMGFARHHAYAYLSRR
jgi:GNAT superfamily N-acetyltransferase